jgi:hypothetical protein
VNRPNFITRLERLPTFDADFKRLDAKLQAQVADCLRDLVKNPIPAIRRFEKLEGYRNPNIFTVHVTRNHSHKLSFEMIGGTALLRRISTHKVIDRAP